MDASFWLQRWSQQQIGFHLSDVNPLLRRHWPSLQVAPGAHVLVPLCGKSLDLLWLLEQGLRVTGVELAAQAVDAFFAEQGLQPERQRVRDFTVSRVGNLEIWQGDFFDLQAADVPACRAFYDRAALIALPPDMRERYVERLSTLLERDAQGLLISLDYDLRDMEGPPFSVSPDEVQQRFSSSWKIELLETSSALDAQGRFRDRAMRYMDERVYRLRR